MNTTSMTNVTGWAPDAVGVPVERVDADRVAAFIAAHKLESWVELAVRLARESFPRAERFTIEMDGAPGEYGECLFVRVATGLTGKEALDRHDEWVARWVASTPAWVGDLMCVSTWHG